MKLRNIFMSRDKPVKDRALRNGNVINESVYDGRGILLI